MWMMSEPWLVEITNRRPLSIKARRLLVERRFFIPTGRRTCPQAFIAGLVGHRTKLLFMHLQSDAFLCVCSIHENDT